MIDHDKNFCLNIQHLRQVHNMTQAQMAKILGISTGTLRRIERNAPFRLTSRMLCRVCDHFDLSIDSILCENRPELLRTLHGPISSE